MIAQPWLAAAAVCCAVAAVLWGRASSRLRRAVTRIEAETAASSIGSDATDLARSGLEKNLHNFLLYLILTVGLGVASLSRSVWFEIPLLAVSVPVVVSIRFAPRFFDEARLAENRAILGRRAEEVLAQDDLAPRRWTERLAPEELPQIDGFELGRVYEPGTGLMAPSASPWSSATSPATASNRRSRRSRSSTCCATSCPSTGTRPRPSRS
jgi:hypothetical protein